MTEEEMNARIAELENEVAEAKKAKSTALGEKNKAAHSLKTLEDRIAELEGERDEARDAGKSEAEKASATLQKQIDKLTKSLADSEKREATYKIDGAISAAIAKAGVLPDAVAMVSGFLKNGVTMENGEAMFEGAPFADRLNTYFSSNEARLILSAPNNSGGGAQGSSAKASEWTKPPVTADEMEKWDQYIVANPAAANSQADIWNRPDLRG